MRRYVRGYRCGDGHAIAVALTGTLVEFWQTVSLRIEHGAVIVMQVANTGLTAGSTPFGDDYARDVVVVGTLPMRSLLLLDGGRQILAFPSMTLDALGRPLEPLGRKPHSMIGSLWLGASVVGGACNNFGGSLIQRGPAYTEQALFARVTQDGWLKLVNHLEVSLGTTPIEFLERLDRGGVPPEAVGHLFCHVFHRDYFPRKGADLSGLKQGMLALLDGRRARYSA